MSEPLATLTIDGSTVIDARIYRVECEEALSEGFRCLVTYWCGQEPDLDALPGTSASLSLPTAADVTRDFHGVVASVTSERPPNREGVVVVELEIVPRLYLARVGSSCRIFQDLSVPDIVTMVLGESNPESGSAACVDAESLEWATNGSYDPLPYVTQFNESDYDFVMRLLAAEGIGVAVRNDLDAEKLVFFDDDTAFVDPNGDNVLFYSATSGVIRTHVFRLRESHVSRSDKVALRDYDYTQAGTDLTSQTETEGTTGREVYEHPGDYQDPDLGERRAQLLLERLRVDARTFHGESNYRHLEPGRKVTLENHPRLDLNGDVLLTRVVHRWSAPELSSAEDNPGYRNEFDAIPLTVPYRPRALAAPTLGGVHRAFVTGPAGQELHGSERGEVKVRFPWDRSGTTDDTSSTWCRVGQFALSGPMLVPRVGFEVLVDYQLGDLDRPFVGGHLYNREAMPPYELPGGASMSSFQTATTDGGDGANELRIEDAGGGEQIMFNASYDYVCSVENNSSSNVTANESSTVGSNSSCAIGSNLTTNVVGARSLTVGGNQNVNVEGDLNQGTTGAWDVTVGNRKDTVGGDLTENVTGNLSRSIGGLQNITAIGGFTRKVAGSSSVTVGGAWVEMTAASRASTCVGRLETVGALKMVKAKTMSVAAGAAYAMTAASETVKCGGNRTDTAQGAIGITAGGGLSIKADNINITAESKIVLNVGGSQITITSGGVKMKSPKVDLGKVKELPSNTHKSN